MPILFSSFPGWHRIAKETVGAAATDTITISNLSILPGDELMLLFELSNATGGSINVSLYFHGDETATNYYTEYTKSVVNVKTSSLSNNAIISVVAAGKSTVGYGFIISTAGITLNYIGSNINSQGAGMFREDVALDVTIEEEAVTSITIKSSVAAGFVEGSSVTLLKRV